jgi:hypothetical protein
MGQATGQERAEQLRSEIEDLREDVGDTAAALAAKTDIKARAQERAIELKATAQEKAKANPVPLAAAGGAFLLTLLIARKRSRR